MGTKCECLKKYEDSLSNVVKYRIKIYSGQMLDIDAEDFLREIEFGTYELLNPEFIQGDRCKSTYEKQLDTISLITKQFIDSLGELVNKLIGSRNKVYKRKGMLSNYSVCFTVKRNVSLDVLMGRLKLIGNCSYLLHDDKLIVIDNTNQVSVVSNKPLALPKDSTNLFSGFHFKTLTLKGIDYSNVEDLSGIFSNSIINKLIIDGGVYNKLKGANKAFAHSAIANLVIKNIDAPNLQEIRGMFSSIDSNNIELSNIKLGKLVDISYLFSGCRIGNLVCSELDTSTVKNMSSLFMGSTINNLNIPKLYTSNVTDMSCMYAWSKIGDIDLSNINTSSVVNMERMFNGCYGALHNIGTLNTSNVINMSYMFYKYNGDKLDVTGLDTSNVKKVRGMFSKRKYSLLGSEQLDFRNAIDADINYI